MTETREIRKTGQLELPVERKSIANQYNIYPSFDIGPDLISRGYQSLANGLSQSSVIKIDGYVGIIFESVRKELTQAFHEIDLYPHWINVEDAMKSEKDIEQMIEPYLGGNDPIFGRVSDLELIDFFDPKKLAALSKIERKAPIIFYGIGAELVPVKGPSVFMEVSKNEIQFRSRAESISNLGASKSFPAKEMYKRFYFIDWPVLNRHKNSIKDNIDFLVDGQRTSEITWLKGDHWRKAIKDYVQSPIRVRPWFEPGAWGGHWIKEHIKGLSEDVVNYAWSFELIVPENGVLFESSALLLEFSFDFLMYHAGREILGSDFDTYKYEFPIRFDFLDTFDGGNLSIQCHPQKDYIKKNFGENITQEETYYILDKKENAKVYLGFQQGVTPASFKTALQYSLENNKELEISDYIQTFEANKHELYLIPPGTIHGSGKNNLVLEISSTPYIYTFKMYDWLRLDLDGKPRPINIERGMQNLNFDRSGNTVKDELISSPRLIEANNDWELEHLPTHKEHLYDIHRYTIKKEVSIKSNNRMQIFSLVEGGKVKVKISGVSSVFHYAETFVIPASVKSFTIENIDDMPVKLVKAFIK
ncbi:mannose-6-phosphate isomerase class I [Salegentibacter sp. 24]|uniref:class I mannose-6-phosphate isomerase n=1 Tax=Salegentibacter sp. 24 TaxID=2183986 RepID=UPI0010620723|nr:class I mannose-6-phosphate isomerase [Salegentibacter sp. 24]TDN95023.1 mannose-6-phosphate isomerase class I [Salegentibacter sp. 24]